MKDIMRWTRSTVLIFSVLLISLSGVCLAQSSGSGEIRGTVTDKTGALVAGVTVTAENVNTGVTKKYIGRLS